METMSCFVDTTQSVLHGDDVDTQRAAGHIQCYMETACCFVWTRKVLRGDDMLFCVDTEGVMWRRHAVLCGHGRRKV